MFKFTTWCFNKLSKLSIDLKNNLSKDKIAIRKSLCRSKQFKIVEMDKNNGKAVLSHELYDSNLRNDKVYDIIDNIDIKQCALRKN